MKPVRVYTKIFLSFLLVLIVTEVLIFGLFLFSAGRIFHTRFEQHNRTLVLLARELVEDKIRSSPALPPEENEFLRNLIGRLARTHGSRIWLTGPDSRPLVKSFSGTIPQDFLETAQNRAKDFGDYAVLSEFKKGRFFYITIPVQITKDTVGTLHILSGKHKRNGHEAIFAIGLLGIGLVIALLVRPVSKHITDPLKHLRQSALHIAEGNLSHRASVRSKDEIGELSRAFNVMADRLEKMIRGGRELTANMSHELRTPLTRIRIAEELLRQGLENQDPDDCRKQLDRIRDDIAELDALIDRILALSKLDIHETALKPEPLDLSGLIEELLKSLKPRIEHRHLQLVTDLAADVVFPGDQEALRTAFSNILDNAVKYTAKDGSVAVETRSQGNQLMITVTNTVDPVPKEDLSRIFEPFYRAGRPHEPGSGLGLAIARKIIEKHGGSIGAENVPAGLAIQICLPINPHSKTES